MFQTVEAIDSERDILQADLDSKAEMVANLTEELELGHQQADDANRYSLLTCLPPDCVHSNVCHRLGALGLVVMILFQQCDEHKVQEPLLLGTPSPDLVPCTRVVQGVPACFWPQLCRVIRHQIVLLHPSHAKLGTVAAVILQAVHQLYSQCLIAQTALRLLPPPRMQCTCKMDNCTVAV